MADVSIRIVAIGLISALLLVCSLNNLGRPYDTFDFSERSGVQAYPITKEASSTYFNLTLPSVVLVGDQTWELTGEGWIGTHTLQIVEANKEGWRFWGYYCHPWIGIGLAWSNDLLHWTKYEHNQIISDGRWPSVIYLNETFYMFYTYDYDKDSGIRLAVSEDGTSFRDYETIVQPTSKQRNQNPFILRNPLDEKNYLYYYHGDDTSGRWMWEIRVRVADSLFDLDKAQEYIVLRSDRCLASPSVIYLDGTYYLTAESIDVSSVWNTLAFRSSSPISGFEECSNSPILVNDEACPMQYIVDGQLVLTYSKLLEDKRTWDTRVVFSRTFLMEQVRHLSAATREMENDIRVLSENISIMQFILILQFLMTAAIVVLSIYTLCLVRRARATRVMK